MAIVWWHWLVLGLLLIAAEIAAAGGFYIIFFGIAAIARRPAGGARRLAGPSWMQMLLFSVLSVGVAAVLPRPLLRWMQLDAAGRRRRLARRRDRRSRSEDMPPGGVGKVELRGTSWTRAQQRRCAPSARARAAAWCASKV